MPEVPRFSNNSSADEDDHENLNTSRDTYTVAFSPGRHNEVKEDQHPLCRPTDTAAAASTAAKQEEVISPITLDSNVEIPATDVKLRASGILPEPATEAKKAMVHSTPAATAKVKKTPHLNCLKRLQKLISFIYQNV